jgi:hypothetical protein
MVQQTINYKVGLSVPSKRVSVLDPNLTPIRSSTSQIYTTAFASQFCIDTSSTSTYASGKTEGYVGQFFGKDVIMPNLNTLFYSRLFYIPNATVQDTNT